MTRLFPLFLTLLLLSACTVTEADIVTVQPTRLLQATKPPLIEPSDLFDQWTLSYVLLDEEKQSPFFEGQWISFNQGGKGRGSDKCNSFHFSYTVSADGKIHFTPGTKTEVACIHIDPETGVQTPAGWDRDFTEALFQTTSIELRGDELWLFYSGSNVLVFK